MDTNKIIDSLGGTSAVAKMCGISTGAVSQWRTSKFGIPKPWVKYFKTSRPELFPEETTKEAALRLARSGLIGRDGT